jgi:hypothetical protein
VAESKSQFIKSKVLQALAKVDEVMDLGEFAEGEGKGKVT